MLMDEHGAVHYTDASGERLLAAFEDSRDADRFRELTQAFPELSADELLICIEQREGASHLWREFARAIATKRGSEPAKPKSLFRSPIVSGEQADEFLASFEWQRVRMIVIERDGAKCACCGRTRLDGIIINVDHIKPRKRYPHLALDPKNLQVLCNECNLGKGNLYETDWRH